VSHGISRNSSCREWVTESILCLWPCHRISCVSTSSGNKIDYFYNSQ
jgi:predicted metal-binding protein